MVYVPSHERVGVSCRFAVSCRDGWVLAVESGSDVQGEVVGFADGGPTVLGVFEHGLDALALYNRDVRLS
jgi:hypothetical protein